MYKKPLATCLQWCFLLVALVLVSSCPVSAWPEHPLLAYPVLSPLPGLAQREGIPVKSLKTFLLEEEAGLESLLENQEAWSREHLTHYAPRPETLAFRATGNPDDVLKRFFHAIRINPNSQMRLYLHLLPGESPSGKEEVSPRTLTTLSDTSEMHGTRYVELVEGELVSPLQVLCTANDEPDFGLDLGLFEDNGTDYGALYGFGNQPFGNPNLEYSSQAPFHMGFYHESPLVFFFGPFLQETYPEYRIHLYKSLSDYAFQSGQDYWGWRFMGWAMHYLGDLSMPYHASVLPGVSPTRMIWTNLKAMLGMPQSRDDAIQIVSNRHTVMEKFQQEVLRRAHREHSEDHPFFQALKNPVEMIHYTDDFPRQVAASQAAAAAERTDAVLERWMPPRLVADPGFEVSGSAEMSDLVASVAEQGGDEAIDQITVAIAEQLRHYSMHLRSFYAACMVE